MGASRNREETHQGQEVLIIGGPWCSEALRAPSVSMWTSPPCDFVKRASERPWPSGTNDSTGAWRRINGPVSPWDPQMFGITRVSGVEKAVTNHDTCTPKSGFSIVQALAQTISSDKQKFKLERA